MNTENFIKVNDILVKQLMGTEEVLTIKPETTLDELGADSLDKVEIIMILEEEFDIDIDNSEVENFNSVKDITDYLGRVL
jgi:acyl carrier protein